MRGSPHHEIVLETRDVYKTAQVLKGAQQRVAHGRAPNTISGSDFEQLI